MLHSAGPASSSCVRSINQSLSSVSVVGGDNKTCARFHQQPTGLLQQSVGCHWSTAAQTASDPECRCSSCYRRNKVRAYDASSAQSALATCSASDHVQDSSHRVQVSPRPGAAVPHRVLHVDVIRCWSSSPEICLHSPAHHSTHEDKLRRP